MGFILAVGAATSCLSRRTCISTSCLPDDPVLPPPVYMEELELPLPICLSVLGPLLPVCLEELGPLLSGTRTANFLSVWNNWSYDFLSACQYWGHHKGVKVQIFTTFQEDQAV